MRFRRRWDRRRAARAPDDRFTLIVAAVALVCFCGTLWLATPDAPGREDLVQGLMHAPLVQEHTTDQHFANCSDARARGRQNIPVWDPSYRERMDRDGDGVACESYRY